MSLVLIVDDDAKVRELLRRFLEPAGHQVIEASSAEEAVQQVELERPDVTFCDMHMPGGANGLWLADRVRAVSPTTALVLATGDTRLPPNETLRSGVVAYLVKPLNRTAVVRAVSDGVEWAAAARAQVERRQKRAQLGSGPT